MPVRRGGVEAEDVVADNQADAAANREVCDKSADDEKSMNQIKHKNVERPISDPTEGSIKRDYTQFRCSTATPSQSI